MSMLLSFPIWEKLGGRDHALQLIEAETKKPLKRETVYRWVWQRKLPSKIALICVNEAIQRGLPVSADDCEIRGVPHLRACASPGRPKKEASDDDDNQGDGANI